MLSALIFSSAVAARFLHSLPEDLHAFPKSKVSFLNSLPVSNETAQKWLAEGLRGGQLQFMDQPWNDQIVSSSDSSSLSTPSPPDYTLEHMKLGPRDSYLCFIPKPLDLPPPPPEEEADGNVTPAHSWSLLQPLSGTCLYLRQLWFTYSYCHNDIIRQFKALPQLQSNGEGGYKPVEDPDYESYTLGKAPPQPGSDLSIAEENSVAANLELARGSSSRYLVQRWDDGTICDKTGKPRQVEVQFHCSMTMSDHILFVKETKTCSYVLVVNTPRLCGEPGFKSRRDIAEQRLIRCRQIVDSSEPPPPLLVNAPDDDHAERVPKQSKPSLPVPTQKAPENDRTKEAIANFLRTVLSGSGDNTQESTVGSKNLPNDEAINGADIVLEFLDDIDAIQVINLKGVAANEPLTAETFANALKAAALEAASKTESFQNGDEKDETDEHLHEHDPHVVHDEL